MTGGVDSVRKASGFFLLFFTGCLSILLISSSGFADDPTASVSKERNFWPAVIKQAKAAGLPTQFLRAIDPEFMTLEFDDLHAFAAEYHPEDHRLILNRALSFNGAGGMLKPLSSLAPREVGTLYHELFHAYIDYLSSGSHSETVDAASIGLLSFAKDRQQCWYQQVTITPIVQRKTRTEMRFLTERESWEALNETWAVFVGWAIWTQLELQRGAQSGKILRDRWSQHLKKADQNGDLIGYYEPEAPAEQAIARKRYLAPSHRITPDEVRQLLHNVLEYPAEEANRAAGVMLQNRMSLAGSTPCRNT